MTSQAANFLRVSNRLARELGVACPIKLLCVGDKNDYVFLRQELQQLHYEFDWAPDANSAINKLLHAPVDACLVDIGFGSSLNDAVLLLGVPLVLWSEFPVSQLESAPDKFTVCASKQGLSGPALDSIIRKVISKRRAQN
jgi:hypothetical protein